MSIITFDGEGASGKSSLAQEVSKVLKIPYLPSGLIYRLSSFLKSKLGTDFETQHSLVENNRAIVFWDGTSSSIYLDGEDITKLLGRKEIGELASINASIPLTQVEMNNLIFTIIRHNGLRSFTVDGRNVGTGLFPNADYKFYITATIEIRALRRYYQAQAQSEAVSYQDVLKELTERDERDLTRELYPMRIPNNAVILDSSQLTLNQMCDLVINKINEINFR